MVKFLWLYIIGSRCFYVCIWREIEIKVKCIFFLAKIILSNRFIILGFEILCSVFSFTIIMGGGYKRSYEMNPTDSIFEVRAAVKWFFSSLLEQKRLTYSLSRTTSFILWNKIDLRIWTHFYPIWTFLISPDLTPFLLPI